MDPLSDVLSVIRPCRFMTGGITAGGRWALGFTAHKGIKCYSVAAGECWLTMESAAAPVRLRVGDCLLLPHGRPFVLASDLTLTPVDVRTLLPPRPKGGYNGIIACAPGEDFLLLGSHFDLEGDARVLLEVLPPLVLLPRQAQQEPMRASVERMIREMRDPQPGGALVAQQVAYTLLVEALRLRTTDATAHKAGCFTALADRRMRAALSCMHDDPARPWSLQELASRAGMSRTAFAQTFKRMVGSTPMEYLTRWRMTLAADRLRNGSEPISTLAPSLGYQSESAFSAAFKRIWGSSPRQHIRAAKAIDPIDS